MSEIKEGGPAFPVSYEVTNALPDDAIPGHLYPVTKGTIVCTGMTLRDYFAAKAMAAFIGNNEKGLIDMPWVAEGAYKIADIMLKAREQP